MDEKQKQKKGGVMPDNEELKKIQRLLDVAEGNLHQARNQLLKITGGKPSKADDVPSAETSQGEIIEGIFDGKKMVTPDGREFQISQNYASKSKLVEGDALKLTIADDGSYIYKQIGPIERKKLTADLVNENGQFIAQGDGEKYKLLDAAVTYYKAKAGDKISVVVPKEGVSEWAALEDVIQKASERNQKEEQKKTPKENENKDEDKFDIPDENKKALEKLRSSILKSDFGESKKQEKQQDESAAKETPSPEQPQQEEPVGQDENQAPKQPESAPQKESDSANSEPEKKEPAVKSQPPKEEKPTSKINKRGTYVSSEDDDYVKEQKETNALGEGGNNDDAGRIKELEI